jgi:putative ABC transport system ATP-binding protein
VALTLSQLAKRFIGPDGSVVPVVDIEHFSIADGEQVALVGSSGSGKTTLLHLIAGILTPDSGKIIFGTTTKAEASQPADKVVDYARLDAAVRADGTIDLARLTEAERDVFRGRNIGYIFQTHHLLGGFTALENVLLGMSFTGRAADRGWATHLLEEVGLADRLHYKPQKLSVGQQQRVAVARALANRPKLVLADEPTGALDAKNAQQVLDLIRKLSAEVQASLLLVSHDRQITAQFPRVVTLAELNRVSTESSVLSPHASSA